MINSLSAPMPVTGPPKVKAIQQAKDAQSDFLVIGIVGAAGAGTSWTARVLRRLLESRCARAEIVGTPGKACSAPAACDGPPRWSAGRSTRSARREVAGDWRQPSSAPRQRLRRNRHDRQDSGALGRRNAQAVVICNSLKHPDEARLLRMVYGDAFWLLGAVCDLDTRRQRLVRRFAKPDGTLPERREGTGVHRAQSGRQRARYGRHVAAAFEIADYFVDTSPPLRDYRVPDPNSMSGRSPAISGVSST